MNKLNVLVCEKFYPYYQKIVKDEALSEVEVISLPCLCEDHDRKAEILRSMNQFISDKKQGILLSGIHCDSLKQIARYAPFEISISEYFLNYLGNENIISDIQEKGGYLVAPDWLENWKKNISNQGFDKDSARDSNRTPRSGLVLIDNGMNEKAKEDLGELSEFLDLPYQIIPMDMQTLRLTFLNAVYKWELSDNIISNDQKIGELQSQYKEYSYILDFMANIATLTNKRETIERIKEIFQMLFKAKKIKYWSSESEKENLTEEVNEFFSCMNKYMYQKKDCRFCIKIQWNDKTFGAVEINDLSAETVEDHLNFALDIGKICGAVLSNIEEYDHFIKSQKELKYISYHDPLTGLYNRAYLNVLLERQTDQLKMIVFLFNIDGIRLINDNFGHSEGDKLIKNTAAVLKKTFRETDCLARVGGDEFAAILPQSDRATAELVQKRFEDEIDMHNKIEEFEHLKIGISSGFAVTDEDEGTLEELFHLADERMNDQKQMKRLKSK